MKRRFLTLLLAMLLSAFLPCLWLRAEAAETATSGTCGENVYWSYDEATQTLTISGKGAMKNYGEVGVPWMDIRFKKLIIEEGITHIGSYAFNHDPGEHYFSLSGSDLILPSTLKSIGDGAFYEAGLAEVTFPEGLQEIGAYAFHFCRMTKIILPDSVTYIGDYAFQDNGDRTSYIYGDVGGHKVDGVELNVPVEVRLPANPTYVGGCIFSSAQNGISSVAPTLNFMLACEGGTFSGVTIEDFVVPAGLVSLKDGMFGNPTTIKHLTLPESLAKIERGTFSKYSSVDDIYYQGSNKEYIKIYSDEYDTDMLEVLDEARWHLGTTAAAHPYKVTVVKPVTCRTDGINKYTCSCGYDFHKSVQYTGHDFHFEKVETTCTTRGGTIITCNSCDFIQKDLYSDPYEHRPSTVVVIPPTCTERGYTTRTCDRCGYIEITNYVAATGHSYTDAVVTAPTCTEKGYTTHTCDTCGYSYTNKEVAALGHDYKSIVTVATCTTGGFTTYTCATCSHSYVGDEVAALGHDYKAVVTAPTCTTDGYTTYTCAVCSDSYVSDRITAPGHDYASVVTNPTCTEDGYTTHTCNVCGDSYTDAIVAAPGHAYETVVTKPTCINGGYTTHTCATCGDSYTDDETEALGHDLQFSLSLYPATCTREGKDIHSCGRYRCYYSEVVTLEADGHDYEAVVTDPTCTEAGYTTYTCTCGHSYVGDEVEATGHFYETAVTDPTCTEAGYTTYTCECGESYVDDEVEATGHSYEAVVTDPTCTEGGYTTYTCACGDSYTAEETEATGHSYEAVVTEPTCTEKGYTTYTCACGDSYTGDETEALGHDNQDGVCSRCGEAILSIVSQSQSVWVPEGQKVTVTVEAVGDGLTYKWYYKNPGESKYTYTSSFVGNTYSVIMNEDRDGRYVYCKITDSYGNTVKSKTVSINMQTPLEILTQPKSVRVYEGATAKVTVKAQGDGLTYKWYYKNPGASKYIYTDSFTGNSYSITMNEARSGRYVYCKVYDKYGNFIKTNTVSLRMK